MSSIVVISEELKEKFSQLKEKIDRYSNILIFLQKYSDLDAAGSSIALLNLIKHNYKNKEIFLIGFDQKPNGIQVPEEYIFDKNHDIVNELDTLGISVDVCNRQQIKNKDLLDKCTEFVIIDHHERHELWDQMKRKPLLINFFDYGSCCGLLFKIAKHNEWKMCKDVLVLLAKGHYGDTRANQGGIPGVWEIYHEIQCMGVDISAEINVVNRRPLFMMRAFNDILRETEQDGKALLLTWTKTMSNKYSNLQQSLFTFPLVFLQTNVKSNTLIYFHHLLRETPKQITIKNIFVALIKENPELEELLLDNGFVYHRSWFYKRCDLMEFKELFRANRELFTR